MKVAALFAAIVSTASAFAPSTPLSVSTKRSDSTLSMAMERTYIMVSHRQSNWWNSQIVLINDQQPSHNFPIRT